MRFFIALSVFAAILVCATGAVTATAAPVFSTPIDVSSGGDNAYAPQVAIDRSGNALALWLKQTGPGYVVESSFRPAGGTFSTPVELSDPTRMSFDPHVAFDGDGNAIAVWTNNNGANYITQVASRPAGGSFSVPVDLSAAGGNALSTGLALNDAGDAIVSWARNDGGGWRIQASSRPTGGSFSAAETLTTSADDAGQQEVAIDDAGNAVAVWIASDGSTYGVHSAYRPAGGTFTAPVRLTDAGLSGSTPHVAVDGAGRAVAVWSVYGGPSPQVQSATSSGGGVFSNPTDIATGNTFQTFPQVAVNADGDSFVAWQDPGDTHMLLRAASGHAGAAFSAPTTISSGDAGQPEPQVGIDGAGHGLAIWGTSTGVQAVTRSASGAFSAPVDLSTESADSPNARLAVNNAGDAIVVWRSHSWAVGPNGTIQAAVGSIVGDDPGQAAVGKAPSKSHDRPLLSRLTLSPRPFRAKASGTTMIAKRSKGGAMIRYRLSKDATTTFTVQIREPGRRAGRHCVKPSAANTGAQRCTRWHTLKAVPGDFTRSGKAGMNSLRFSGRIGEHSLTRGRYRLVAKTVDGAGNLGRAVVRSFTIRK